MDILNIISWVKGKRQVTSVDPTKSLIPVAQKDDRRDDGYLTGVISVEDLLAASASVIGVNGTTLYSTNPLAGPSISNSNTIALGQEAGYQTADAHDSNFLGSNAGYQATNAQNSNFFGYRVGQGAAYAVSSNFLGTYAGYNASSASNCNFFGDAAGLTASNANNSNFLGSNAGSGATSAYRSNFLGLETGMNSAGNNVNAFGYRAHASGTLSGQTVFSNSSLASYLNRATAVAAITVPLGASAGSTYLYYNQTTFAIEAVRL